MSTIGDILCGIAGLAVAAAGGLAAFTAASTRRAERLVPPDGRFLDVPGGRIHYTDEGSGPPILLIHGLGGQLRNFARPLVGRLARSHRVIALDRPGSGYSTLSGIYPDLVGQARMVATFIEALGLGPVVLAGHSLGGALSLALVQARPDLVRSLALVAPLTQTREDAPDAFRILTIRSARLRSLVGWTLVAPFSRLASSERRKPVFAPDPVPDDFESRGGGALVYRPRGFDAASRDIQGVPTSLPGIVAQIRGAKLHLVNGGHMLPFTHPIATADWIEAVASRMSAE